MKAINHEINQYPICEYLVFRACRWSKLINHYRVRPRKCHQKGCIVARVYFIFIHHLLLSRRHFIILSFLGFLLEVLDDIKGKLRLEIFCMNFLTKISLNRSYWHESYPSRDRTHGWRGFEPTRGAQCRSC